MAIALHNKGLTLKYAVEATAGTRPTTGYTQVARLRSMPDFNEAPNGIDVTELDELNTKQYISGLSDPGGAKAFHANLTDDFMTKWEALRTAYETAQATAGGALNVWYEISHPKLAKSFYFCGEPAPLGFSAAEVDNALEIDAYITPQQIVGWAAKSGA